MRTKDITQWLRYKYYSTCDDETLLECMKLTCRFDYINDDAACIEMLNAKALLYPLFQHGSYGHNKGPLRLQCEIRDDEFEKEIQLPNGDVCVVHVEKTYLLPGHQDKYFIDMVDEIVKVRSDALRDK